MILLPILAVTEFTALVHADRSAGCFMDVRMLAAFEMLKLDGVEALAGAAPMAPATTTTAAAPPTIMNSFRRSAGVVSDSTSTAR